MCGWLDAYNRTRIRVRHGRAHLAANAEERANSTDHRVWGVAAIHDGADERAVGIQKLPFAVSQRAAVDISHSATGLRSRTEVQ